MDTEHLLKIPQSESDEYVLVNVKRIGSRPLDLRLVATDGSDVYVSEVKHSKISKLQVKHSPVDETVWESILLSTLLIQVHNDGKGLEPGTSEKLELAASITESQLLLVFRRNISGITQRLGEIALHKNDDESIELYEWAAAAADTTTDLARAVRELDIKFQDQANTIKKLNQQLENLIQAKKEHETLLLEKFQALLNTKKLKIRDQQRLLAGAKVDPQKAAQIQDARQSQTPRSPEASRAAKRKAKGKSPHTSGSEPDEPGLEQKPAVVEESDTEQKTPSHSDLETTEDEDEDGKLDSMPRPDPSSGKGKTLERQTANEPVSQPARQMTPPPPPRELPFTKETTTKASQAANSQSAATESQEAKGDDSETSDDEL